MRLILLLLIATALPAQRIHSGGAVVGDWQADAYFTGGTTWVVAGGSGVYSSLRFGTFSYQFPVPDGDYLVHLSFIEPSVPPGQRSFDVLINGATVLSSYDIAAAVGIMKGTEVATAVTARNSSGIKIQFTTKIRNAVVSGIVVEKKPRPYATVSVLDGPDACQPGSSYYGLHYGGNICSVPQVPPGTPGTWFRDLNYGGSVTALTPPGETWLHGYSLPSAFSATNRYVGVTDTNGNHYALDRVSGSRQRVPGNAATIFWDAANDDWLYYPNGRQWMRYSVSTGSSIVIADYSSKWTGNIQNGGSTHLSSDNWTAFWSNEDHLVCALDFTAQRTYCADFQAPETKSDKLPFDFIDYSVVTDVDAGSGKRYVMMMSAPALGGWSVDMAAGALHFEFRGGENPASQGFNQPTGNGDGLCDPGESCLNAPHGDATSIGGIQYFVTNVEMASTPCQRDLVALPIAQGAFMVARRTTILPLAFCSSLYDWPDIHVGCAGKTGACVISTETRGPSPMGNQVMLMQDLDHVVKLGFHHSQSVGSDTYWFQSRAGISSDGRYIVFDSNLGQPDQGNGFSHEQVFLMRTSR